MSMRREKAKRENHKGIGFIIIAAIFVLFVWYFSGFRSIGEVEAKDYTSFSQKYYTSVEIEEGDTLWEIAEEYMTEEYKDRDTYIEEVCKMNHITGHVIRTGTTILVPYYR